AGSWRSAAATGASCGCRPWRRRRRSATGRTSAWGCRPVRATRSAGSPGSRCAPPGSAGRPWSSCGGAGGALAGGGQYQGVPTAREGNRFKRAWFAVVDAPPGSARRVRYWDKAGTAGGGDYTAGVLLATAGGLFYVEDVVRGQWSAHEREQVLLRTARRDAQAGRLTTRGEAGGGPRGKESAQAPV